MKELYICDNARKIRDGKCGGSGCVEFKHCFLTTDKEYAKEYVTIYEAYHAFQSAAEIYHYEGDEEKAKQYENAIKSLVHTIRIIDDKFKYEKLIDVDEKEHFIKADNQSVEELASALNGI